MLNLRFNRTGRSLKYPIQCILSHAAKLVLSLLRLERPRNVDWLTREALTGASHRKWSDPVKLFHRVLPMLPMLTLAMRAVPDAVMAQHICDEP